MSLFYTKLFMLKRKQISYLLFQLSQKAFFYWCLLSCNKEPPPHGQAFCIYWCSAPWGPWTTPGDTNTQVFEETTSGHSQAKHVSMQLRGTWSGFNSFQRLKPSRMLHCYCQLQLPPNHPILLPIPLFTSPSAIPSHPRRQLDLWPGWK